MPFARIEPVELLANLPAELHTISRRIAAAGGRTWLVGGAVRDRLLGDQSADFDLVTDLLPTGVQSVFPGAETRDARFGVVQLPATAPLAPLAITTLRAEAGYRDHRRPDEVQFVTDPLVDAQRRDFTANALYLDLSDGSLIDPTGGLADLAAGRLRVIGDAAARLSEDPLRLLRAVRFLARCELTPDPALAAALPALAPLVRQVAAERCFDELTRTFVGPHRGAGLGWLVQSGLAAVLLPEVAAMDGVPQPPQYHPEGDVLTHVRLVLDHVPADDPVLAWSAVLHDVGKPPTFRVAADRIRFDGHDVLSARLAETILQRLRAPRALREAVVAICLDHLRIASLPQMRPRRREAWLREPGFRQHLAFHRADCLGSHGNLSIFEFATAELAALPPLRPLPIDGKDVLACGVAPGPAVGRLLSAVAEALAEGAVPWDREHALALLRDCVRQSGQGDGRLAR